MTLPTVTIGMDVGDRYSQLFGVDDQGEVIEEGRLPTTKTALRHRFSGMDPARIVLEVGTHSPWMSRLLIELGHEVLVANPRAVHRRGEASRGVPQWCVQASPQADTAALRFRFILKHVLLSKYRTYAVLFARDQ